MGSKNQPTKSIRISRPNPSFLEDDRAIEGLPIRLVIALVIGVVSLGIMLQILGGVDTFEGETEVDVEFDEEEDFVQIGDNDGEFTVSVIDEDGNDVEDATIVATAGDAQMDEAIVKQTGDSSSGGDDHQADFDFGDAGLELAPDQDTGTVEFEITPPTGSNWADDEPNEELLVIDDS